MKAIAVEHQLRNDYFENIGKFRRFVASELWRDFPVNWWLLDLEFPNHLHPHPRFGHVFDPTRRSTLR